MNNGVFWWCLGVLCGVMLAGVLLKYGGGPAGKAVEAVERCEATLPRNRRCIVTATPETVPDGAA